MLGSPPASAAALPSFLVEDNDFLPAWSRALSASPRLVPAAGPSGAASTSASAGVGGLEAFGLDLAVDRRASQDTPMLDAPTLPSPHDVGNGLSPILGPTLMSASPRPLENRQEDNVGDLSGAFEGQHRSSFESSFNKYHHAPPIDNPAPHKSPTRRKSSHGDTSAPLSFDNATTLPSPSLAAPLTGPGPPTDGRATSAPTAAALHSPILHAPKLESPASANFAHGLPSGLQRRTTLGGALGEQDKGKIQVRLLFTAANVRRTFLTRLLPLAGIRQARVPLVRHLHTEAQRHHRPSSSSTSLSLFRFGPSVR